MLSSLVVLLFQVFNEMFKEHMPEAEVLAMLSHSQEFEQVKVINSNRLNASVIRHFLVALNLIMKARLSAKFLF